MAYQKGHEIPTIDVELVTIKPKRLNAIEYGLNTASKIEVNVQSETEDSVKLVVKGRLIAQKPSTTTITGNTIVLTDNVFNPEIVKILQGGTITYSKKFIYEATGTVAAGGKYFSIGTVEEPMYVAFVLDESLSSGDTIEFNDTTQILLINDEEAIFQMSDTIPVDMTAIIMTSEEDQSVIASYAPPVAGSDEKGEAFVLRAYSAQYDAAGLIVNYECIEYPNCQGVPVAFSSEDNVFRVPEYTINSAPKKNEAPYKISYMRNLPVVATT